jgi:hypothetical protein
LEIDPDHLHLGVVRRKATQVLGLGDAARAPRAPDVDHDGLAGVPLERCPLPGDRVGAGEGNGVSAPRCDRLGGACPAGDDDPGCQHRDEDERDRDGPRAPVVEKTPQA